VVVAHQREEAGVISELLSVVEAPIVCHGPHEPHLYNRLDYYKRNTSKKSGVNK